MASSSSFYVFLCSLAVFLFLGSHAAKPLDPFGSTGIHLSIRKNMTSLQYYTPVEMGSGTGDHINILKYSAKLVIDLGGQLLWVNCDEYNSTSYRPIPCGSAKCKAARGSGCVGCNLPPRPGCTNNTCGVYAYNSIKNLLASEGLGEDVMSVYSTNGVSIIVSYDVPHFPFSCAAPFLLKGLASGTNGMIGLARTPTSLPNQIALAIKLPHPRKFALCIPSSTESGFGDIFIGGGPYYMAPYAKDLSKLLTTTPLLTNPVSTAPVYSEGEPSDEYFIGVKAIRVDGTKLVSFNISLLAIDKKGVGGTKLSPIAPYTLLHTSIYKALVSEFVKKAATKKIKRVTSVAPFGACFSTKTLSSTQTGPFVPTIDLVLQKDSVYWRIYGANSMVQVNKDVLCLGFVDGGSNPRTSIVVGGHQMENYVLEFDTSNYPKFGFSSSLLLHNSSCSHSRIF
ncbi:Peptidase A1 protein [Actinidia chinensis var. chinensis]|uniref:Peptidase A1 protein n=1 Tax=Actinidia chinensis var. chinensis TaxID=1590841 RepID=A0A2R6P2Z5_ACTCC|nr:Peptidase A1 protein [Actinidia chinensis var. chinensis]